MQFPAELGLQADADLRHYNTLGVPARARYLTVVNSTTLLTQALQFAHEANLAVLVLGQGSNTVLTRDFDGLVIHNQLRGVDVIQETDSYVELRVAAGENWHQFVSFAVTKHWYGVENLALIPGLVGAAPIQNIGAYGVEVKDVITAVEYVDRTTLAIQTLSNDACQFAYRDSVFKNALCDATVITAVQIRLNKRAALNLDYPALADQAGKQPSLESVFDAVCRIRTQKLPDPAAIPNAGSFFKNPVVTTEHHQRLKSQFPDLIGFATDDGYKLAAGWLIDQAGWKNKEISGVRVHRQQALVVINPSNRSGADVMALAAAIQQDIVRIYDVQLEVEPRIY
ncbi:UDP-N-acetylenolpyruvoylglucosamine reductase [Arenicella chitinivorans]|uniref:UDP-N-acetylenolpyruvoylglucosamine reductase n=1 Tax=Arenicella chitinivorans TaxID=1329800 RepID=A0A918VN59_9GAMM|nr:UDP-N-acetylmuramate dehydrogenase [Arenicella chitinivorans]GHA11801.1 UDP-N-acetylenolpyruvoylglucosamine reductase [Arenicella chitinivorans]